MRDDCDESQRDGRADIGPTSAPSIAPVSRQRRASAWLARGAAAAIALIAWGGLAAGCTAVFGRTHAIGATLWVMVAYFTNTTGLLIALLFTVLAVRPKVEARSSLIAAASLMVLLVGIVQRLLLQGLRPLYGADVAADLALHILLPVLVPVFWLAFADKGRLRLRDPVLWALYPLTYLGWALLRGALDGRAIYPFIDPAVSGWGPVVTCVAAITASFLLIGWVFVLFDRSLAALSTSVMPVTGR